MPKSSITSFSGLDVNAATSGKNLGLYLPRITTAQRDAIPAATLKNGAMIFNVTVGDDGYPQMYNGGQWYNLYYSVSARGDGLTRNNIPFVLPVGERVDVEVGVNEVQGFIYIDSTNDVIRYYRGDAWRTVTNGA